jgi:lipid-binding SYLF domain-containing protein
MKKLLLATAILFGCLPAFAQDNAEKRAELVERLRAAELVLQEFQLRPETAIPPAIWAQARAIIIVKQFKAGFILGYQGGYGVMMVKKPTGRWSLPVIIDATEGSLGFQIGASTVDSIYIITNDETPRLLFNRRFNVGVDAKAVAGPLASEAERTDRPILEAPVLIYSRNLGLYAGATIKAAQLARDDRANFILYNTNYRLPELLYSDWVSPPAEVQPLMTLMQRFAP